MDTAAASWKRFYVFLAGVTNGAHLGLVSNLKGIGHIQVSAPEESDYILVFCPISSRVGTDISEAENSMPRDKPVILVVMHHTFNHEHVVAESSRQGTHPYVCLTVNCLFYEDRLLECNRNDIVWLDIQKFLGVSASQISTNKIIDWLRTHLMLVTFGVVFIVLVLLIIWIIEMLNVKKG